jgi:hypothetical protein
MAKVEPMATRSRTDREMEILATIRDSGVINFEQLGKVVSQITPALFDPGIAADDYVVKGIDSVIHVWKLSTALTGLEQIESLRTMGAEMRE